MNDAGDNSRRSLILKTAAMLFRQHGYERTSVRQIAEALGMTSGSIFYHFTTKEELLVTVMEEGVRDILSGVQDGLAGESRLPERMLAMVRCHLTALLGPKLDAMTVMLYEWRSLSEPARARVLTSRDAYEVLWMAQHMFHLLFPRLAERLASVVPAGIGRESMRTSA
jgi:AcrR family transcriptional regulator